MCKVSSATIKRANERTKVHRFAKPVEMPQVSPNAIAVSTSYNGKVYGAEISLDNMRQAYGRALKAIKSGHGE